MTATAATSAKRSQIGFVGAACSLVAPGRASPGSRDAHLGAARDAREEPELFATEVRGAFGSLRSEDAMSSTGGRAAVFDEHMAAEFAQQDLDAATATMSQDPHVYHVPVMTGGVGFEGVRRFYGEHFIGKWPHDTQITPVSRTVGEHRVVDEIVVSFTHEVEMDALLPGVPPTGKSVRLPICVVVEFDADRIAHEHIYWDQASLLVQIGVLDRAGLPVTGGEQVDNLLDPSARAMNQLMGERA